MIRASDVLEQAARDGVLQHRGALTDREAKSLSALGVLAWKAGALYAENYGKWKIDHEIFAEAYGWKPDTVSIDEDYYDEEFESLSREEQEKILFRALMSAKVGTFMSLVYEAMEDAELGSDEISDENIGDVSDAMENAELDSYEVSDENIGDFLMTLNEMEWPFTRIAKLLKQSGL